MYVQEAPATQAADPKDFIDLANAAVRLGQLVGYQSAGTVEYLYTANGYYFLELNPRLQVEHPCTEMVTDVNIPAAQLQIAMGIPLHRIADIRALYGFKRFEDSPIDFANPASKAAPKGHVIAARITAENPDEGFKPTSGHMFELNFRSMKNVWGYFSLSGSGGLHEFADSQFGHVFAWGEDREHARRNLVMALKQVSIRGDFRTTLEYLITLLETAAFKKNKIDTSWLDGLIAQKVKPVRPDTFVAIICGAVHISAAKLEERIESFRRALIRGQVPSSNEYVDGVHVYRVELSYDGFKYEVTTTRTGPTSYTLELNQSFVDVELHALADGGRLVMFGGHSHVTYLTEEVAAYRLVVDTNTAMFEKESDPSVLRTTSPGKVIRYLIDDGAHVNEGQPFIEVEVMKMVLTLQSTASGILQQTKQPGAVLGTGDVIGHLQLDDATKVRVIRRFEGTFPTTTTAPAPVHGERIHQRFQKVRIYSIVNHRHQITFPFRFSMASAMSLLVFPSRMPFSSRAFSSLPMTCGSLLMTLPCLSSSSRRSRLVFQLFHSI